MLFNIQAVEQSPSIDICISTMYKITNENLIFVFFLQIIDSIKKEGAQFIKQHYDRESLISKGFNYVQVSVSRNFTSYYREIQK